MSITINLKALEHSATFVNCFEVSRLGDVLVRLSFGEAPTANDKVFRGAWLVHISDVRKLIGLLQRVSSLPTAASAQITRPN